MGEPTTRQRQHWWNTQDASWSCFFSWHGTEQDIHSQLRDMTTGSFWQKKRICIWEGLFRKYRIRALELWLVFMTSWLIFLVAYPAGWRVLYLYFVFSRS